MQEHERKMATDAAIWVTASPHEWTWTHEQQVAMARYVNWAASELEAWAWLTDMRCTVQENSTADVEPWTVLDVDQEIIGHGETPVLAIRAAMANVLDQYCNRHAPPPA